MLALFKDPRTRQTIAVFLKKGGWDAPEVLPQQASSACWPHERAALERGEVALVRNNEGVAPGCRI